MKRLRAYGFSSDLAFPAMFDALNATGPWRWSMRDSDTWGDYASTRVTAGDYTMVKLFVDGSQFEIDVQFRSESPEAEAQFDAVIETLLQEVLPSIHAVNVRPAEPRE